MAGLEVSGKRVCPRCGEPHPVEDACHDGREPFPIDRLRPNDAEDAVVLDYMASDAHRAAKLSAEEQETAHDKALREQSMRRLNRILGKLDRDGWAKPPR